MSSFSKIKIFFILAVIAIAVVSCSKKNDVIPDVTVDFTINLNDPQFVNLNALGGAVAVNRNTNNWGYLSDGYSGSGIIVARGAEEFYAYDRTCPHDYAQNGSVIKVNIDPQGFATAKCPQCGTTYSLISFGTPSSGVGRYPLKNYRTNSDGQFVRVWNSY
ncbi:MAG TPA: hypothetical protein VHO68_15810 [Bacteroidales bacterium]|nr:hypothetical protein [Bacteroidales bacterium]